MVRSAADLLETNSLTLRFAIESKMTQLVRPRITLKPNGTTLLGSGDSCQPRLSHPLVAARHCEIVLNQDRAQLRDLGAGTFLNGRKIVGRMVPLHIDDQVDVGPFLLKFKGQWLESLRTMQSVQLVADRISQVVRERGGEHVRFRDVTLVFNPGDFVCVLGPSGSGKSSLIKVLSGRAAPTDGAVRINDRGLHAQFESVNRHLVLVDQKPLSHQGLTVEQALRFTARLRLPNSSDRAARIDKLITSLKLELCRKKPIAVLSGGEEKRLCLANELVSDPGLVILDEVTSGLDEHIDRQLMRLFRELAEKDRKTILCVTHNLANVPEFCTHVVFLTPGGRLAFAGAPAAALAYFKVDKLGDVYPLLTADRAERIAETFAHSAECRDYLKKQRPEGVRSGEGQPAGVAGPKASVRPRVSLSKEATIVASQSAILAWRQLLLLAKDRWTLASFLGQVLLVALVLVMAFPRFEAFPDVDALSASERMAMDQGVKDPKAEAREKGYVPKKYIEGMEWVRKLLNLTFLLCVTSFWLGCNNAARELVRERAIIRHEQLFNLRPLAYFLSKLTLLTLIGWMQVGLLLLLVWLGCLAPAATATESSVPAVVNDSIASPLWYLPTLLAMLFAGTALGMLISAVSKSETVAVMLIPIAVIPQIILSGAIVTFSKTSVWATVISQTFVTTYWGKQSMDALLTETPQGFAMRKEIEMVDSWSSHAFLTFAFVLLHAAVYCCLTMIILCTAQRKRN